MYSFTKKLLLAKELTFSKGRAFLVGQPVNITPTQILTGMTHQLVEAEDAAFLYTIAKESIKPFVTEVEHRYDVAGEETVGILTNLSTTAGWGNVEVEKFKKNAGEGAFVIHDSPIPELYGKSTNPIDHLVRGLITGALEVVCERDLIGIESHCRATGDSACRILVKPESAFNASRLVQFQNQVTD